jgi:hypothetical protein
MKGLIFRRLFANARKITCRTFMARSMVVSSKSPCFAWSLSQRRTLHVLIRPDIRCANGHKKEKTLTSPEARIRRLSASQLSWTSSTAK